MMKNAIIVGASSGIGYHVALALVAEGWTVGAMARRGDRLSRLLDEAPGRVVVCECDVCRPDATDRLQQLIDTMGGIDLYIHTAGVGRQNVQLDEAVEMGTLDTNVMGFARMVGHAFRYMAAHGGGHIAVVSSIAGTRGLGAAPSYSASKAFQSTYIQALEQLAYSRRIPVVFTDIRPGFVDTALIAGSDFPMKMDERRVARLIMSAIRHHRHVAVIDWRYRLLVGLWSLVPAWLWRRLPLATHER